MSNITLTNELLTIEVSPVGAELRSICANATGISYLWQGDPAHWKRSAPTLFPIAGRLVKGYYTHEGRRYELPIHGFAGSAAFDVDRADAHEAAFTLAADDTTRAAYPFDFRLEAVFTLNGARLTVRYTVCNEGSAPMPYSIGGHPGFNIPFVPGTSLRDYYIAFDDPGDPDVYDLEGGYWTGKILRLPRRPDRIPVTEPVCDQDTLLMGGLARRSARIGCAGSTHAARMEFDDFEFFALWPPPGSGSPYICLEPWNGLPPRIGGSDALAERPGIRMLGPGERSVQQYALTFA